MNLTSLAIFFGILASFNVLVGSVITLRLEKYFNIVLGLSGGIMMGTIAFEVLPEIFHLLEGFEKENITVLTMSCFILGVLGFHFLSKLLPLHEHGQHDEHEQSHHSHLNSSTKLGIYGAVAMILHSFIDGFGIGVSFTNSLSLGLSVALAVLMHNLSDGINTSSTLLINGVKNLKFKILMSLSILAPLSGVIASLFLKLSEKFVLLYLAFFAGSILYLAISEILPHAHSHTTDKKPLLATIVGVMIVLTISLLIPHAH